MLSQMLICTLLLLQSDDSDELMEPLGIVTMEDVIEELIQAEILDETDRYVDNLRRQRVNVHKLLAGMPPHLRKYVPCSPLKNCM